MRGYFMFVRVWAGERDLVTILVSTISFLTYISVVMDYGYKWAQNVLRMNGTGIAKLVHGYTLTS